MSDETEFCAACHHEAGHAAVACCLLQKVESVTVSRRGDGRTVWAPPHGLHPDHETHFTVLLAGRHGEELYTDQAVDLSCTDDEEDVEELLRNYAPEERPGIRRRCDERAEELVQVLEGPIREIARTLKDASGQLSGEDVVEIAGPFRPKVVDWLRQRNDHEKPK